VDSSNLFFVTSTKNSGRRQHDKRKTVLPVTSSRSSGISCNVPTRRWNHLHRLRHRTDVSIISKDAPRDRPTKERLPKEHRWGRAPEAGKAWTCWRDYKQLLLDLGNPKKAKDPLVLAIFHRCPDEAQEADQSGGTDSERSTSSIGFSARERGPRESLRGGCWRRKRRRKEGLAQDSTSRRGH